MGMVQMVTIHNSSHISVCNTMCVCLLHTEHRTNLIIKTVEAPTNAVVETTQIIASTRTNIGGNENECHASQAA
jgi:hypothetical protein